MAVRGTRLPRRLLFLSLPSAGSATPPASTAATQPAKKTGRDAASQERHSALPDNSDSDPESSARGRGPKAPRLSGPEHEAHDVDMRSADERKAEIDPLRPSPASDPQRAPALAHASVSASSLVSSSSAALSSASTSPSLPQMPGVSPAWAQPPRLLQAGVVNFRVLTDLLVDLTVDKRACPAPNVLSNVYRGDATQKCAAATALLGDSKMGFGIKPPVLPRALLTADAAQRAKWSEPQQAWYNQLVEHACALSDCIRESRSTWEQRSAALITVFELINVDEVSKLWPEPQQKTSTWKDLLTSTTAILHSSPREERQRLRTGEWIVVPQHAYRLRLACVNAEASFVVACCIANYALLSREKEKTYDSLCYAHCLSFVFCFDFYVAMLLCSGRCVALADASHFP